MAYIVRLAASLALACTALKADTNNKTQFIIYDIESLRAMGNLTASPSNDTAMVARGDGATNIIGADDRIDWTDSSWPYSTLGKLFSSNGTSCSAILVGPRHIITARHCAPDSNQDVTLRFAPFYSDGETRYQSSQVETVISNNQMDGECYAGQDWAIHILQDRIDEQLGWFGARAISPEWLNRPVFEHFGYPFDKNDGQRPIKSSGGTVYKLGDCGDGSPAWASIDGASGQSGGPIWNINEPYVMGVLHGWKSSWPARGTTWASGQFFVNAIITARSAFP